MTDNPEWSLKRLGPSVHRIIFDIDSHEQECKVLLRSDAHHDNPQSDNAMEKRLSSMEETMGIRTNTDKSSKDESDEPSEDESDESSKDESDKSSEEEKKYTMIWNLTTQKVLYKYW